MAILSHVLVVFGLLAHLERRCHGSGGKRSIVFPYEMCYEERKDLYTKAEFLKYVDESGRRPLDLEFDFVDYDALCRGRDGGLSAMLEATWSSEYAALVGSAEHLSCELLARVARYKRKPFLSWACLQGGAGGWRVQPGLAEAAGAVARAAEALRWRSVVVLSAESGWWWEAAHHVELRLLELGLAPRHLHLTERSWRRSLARLHAAAPAAVILCASHRPEVSGKILRAFDSFHIIPSMVLLIDFFKYILPSKPHARNRASAATGGPELMSADAPAPAPALLRHRSAAASEPTPRPLVSLDPHQAPRAPDPINNKTRFSEFENTRMGEPNGQHITTSPPEAQSIGDITDPTGIFFSPTAETSRADGGGVVPSPPPSLAKDVKINSGTSANNDSNDPGDDVEGNFFLQDIIGDKAPTIKQFSEKNKYLAATVGEHGPPSAVSGGVLSIARLIYRSGENSTTVTTTTSRSPHEEHVSQTARRWRTDERPAGLATTAVVPAAGLASTPAAATSTYTVASDRNSLAPPINSEEVGNITRENPKYKRRKRGARTDNNVRDFFYFDLGISKSLQDSLLVITERRTDSRRVGGGASSDVRGAVFEQIYESLSTVRRYMVRGGGDVSERSFEFAVLERVYESASASLLRYADIVPVWRPVLEVRSRALDDAAELPEPQWSYNVTRRLRVFDEWLEERGFPEPEPCEGEACAGASLTMSSLHIVAIIAGSLLLSTLLAALALLLRNLLIKRRLSKRPNKIVLMANDFVFPQVADSRRVDEGMEAMLCCWLQQLQEFGGPEVDKPDLLKGSVGSLKGLGLNISSTTTAKGPSSNGSITKSNCIIDPRTRYNGDLVQMKYLANVGTFELKRKSTDLLVLMQGLRHENLNPFIGCLCEPSRPAMVFEYCSRGSLEDVLVADDIKLDWTFRLSLLTDLVRGMRYLHTTTLRTHGHLTSRNCVVDARWVLKLTDYGMPAFYRTQGMPPPLKIARDLLWTAPELLRDPVLRERGTQPGDVYSFAIVMQEVVVRGEPFCMLSLSPEEIIEKVKRPPPLIRPSVSKGAAPPEAINIMRQCWTEAPDMRPDFNAVHDLFRKLNHGRKVNFIDTMFQMLEKYSNNLEELIKERTEQLDMEKKKTEQLLNRMLPSYVAEKLKLGMPVDPEEFSEVSIYFSDIVGFTSISAHSSPFQVVDLLNDLYTTFDATINHYNVYKVETIGDAYMVVGGLPVRTRDHAEQVATMALHLLHHAGRFRIRHLPRTPLRLRIGLHTGPCCAGVVGLTMPRYCLFGDTVNTASRMESTGAAWRIHLSQATRDKLEAAGGYSLEYRGPTEIKGKGKMHTYWLLGKAGFDNPLPTPPPLGESHGLEESLIVEKGTLSVSSSVLHKSDDNSSECSSATGATAAAGSGAGATTPRPQRSLSGERSPEPAPAPTSAPTPVLASSSLHHVSVDRSMFRVEATTQQVIDMRKMNYARQDERSVSKQSSGDAYHRKIEQSPVLEATPAGASPVAQDAVVAEEAGERPAVVDGRMLALNAPVSAVEVAAALLGASSTSLARDRRDISRYKRSTVAECDLSTPYSRYKCFSPSDSHLNRSADVRSAAGRLLKRQFSLDRADELSPVVEAGRGQARLTKQNSAGAAHDLERIEEVPAPMPLSPRRYRTRNPPSACASLSPFSAFPSATSVSAESLTDSRLFLSSGMKR